MHLSPGTTLGHYRILTQLGSGGMGEVYRAHDERLGRDLALKVLRPDTMEDENARARLTREARTASSLNHPHIAHIYEIGEESGHLFIAMEMVEGAPLQELIQSKQLAPESVLPFAIQAASALAYAHGRGVIHRDLKSANVMVTPEQRIKILDFGLAKRILAESDDNTRVDPSLTSSGFVVGTPNSLPPEVLLGGKADMRSDVWSFGVLLYEMATGRLPFAGATVGQLADAIVNTAPAPITARVPVALRAIIERCLAKEPDARYADGAVVLAALEKLEQRTRPRKPLLHRIAISVTLLLVLAAGVAIGLGKIRVPGLADPGGGSSATARIRSLAVLPLANLSGDPKQDYFASGMTEELITDLASIRTLKVISRTSAMMYKDTKKSIKTIASELGVDGIIEGSVLRDGDRVRITAQLIEARQDRHLWAKSYDRDFRDVLSLQSEVARDIAREVQSQISPEESGRLAQHRRVDPEAYDLYLKGRYEWGKVTEEGAQKAIEYFEQAAKRDPTDARYPSGIADAYLIRVQLFGSIPPDQGMAKVKEYAGRALKLDDQSAEAHASMAAAVLFADWNWDEAERHLKRSIDLNPGYATSRLIYSVLLSAAGRVDEALAQDRIAEELDPMSLIIRWNSSSTLYYAHRYQEGLAKAKETLRMFPTAMLAQGALVRACELVEDYPAALDLMDRYLPESEGGKTVVARMRKGYAEGGRLGYWRAMLAEHSKHGDSERMTLHLATIYARIGDREKALQYIERALREHQSDLIFIQAEPYFDDLKREPRFQAVARQVGLTPRA
jgi:eukaryotic-like serine/threonine-protein kinase